MTQSRLTVRVRLTLLHRNHRGMRGGVIAITYVLVASLPDIDAHSACAVGAEFGCAGTEDPVGPVRAACLMRGASRNGIIPK